MCTSIRVCVFDHHFLQCAFFCLHIELISQFVGFNVAKSGSFFFRYFILFFCLLLCPDWPACLETENWYCSRFCSLNTSLLVSE